MQKNEKCGDRTIWFSVDGLSDGRGTLAKRMFTNHVETNRLDYTFPSVKHNDMFVKAATSR